TRAVREVVWQPERGLSVPAQVTERHHEGQIGKHRDEIGEALPVLRQVVKGVRKLHEDRTQKASRPNRLDPGPKPPGLGLQIDLLSARGGPAGPVRSMRQPAVELCRKAEGP